jgi:hypothetical protein
MLKAFCLADHENVLQVDLLGVGWRWHGSVLPCLLLSVTGLNEGSETEESE